MEREMKPIFDPRLQDEIPAWVITHIAEVSAWMKTWGHKQWSIGGVGPTAPASQQGTCSRRCSETAQCDNSCAPIPAAPAAVVDAFTKAVKEARRVWMEENPTKEGRDHVTPFDEFLYLSAAPAAVVDEGELDWLNGHLSDTLSSRQLDRAHTIIAALSGKQGGGQS